MAITINKYLLAGACVVASLAIYSDFQRRRKDVPVIFRKRLAHNYNARTVPPFGVFISESQKNNTTLIDHEKTHWKQYQELGLLKFYWQYFHQLKQYGYDHMPMEKEARSNECDYCKDNYTDCVRKGISNTVHNPDFRQ